jgi:phospholipid/cholesterol/gamma-HCH transport system substrate-binding protein
MKTNNNKRAVTVGIFVLVGLLIFIAGILTLGGQKKTFQKKVTIRAVFSDVGGLQVGNNVWYLGVKVGTVKKMTFNENSQVEIVMNIEVKAQKFIKKDAKVKLGSEGFIGNKLVVIYGGNEESEAIAENDVLKSEAGTSTDEMLATLQKNNKNLLDITDNMKLISKRIVDGDGISCKLLSDETLGNNLELAINEFKQASANAQSLTADISNYTSRLQSKGSLTNDLITDTLIYSGLKAAVAQLQLASKKANEVTDNIKLASNNVREVSSNLNSSTSPIGVLLNDQEAGNNLKALLANLQSGTQKLDENMEALQHNFLLRGFFKKKAKKAAKEAAKPAALNTGN